MNNDKTGCIEWRVADRIRYPSWAKKDQRYLRLDMLDRFLEGTFYDHLPHIFWEEVERNQSYIPISDRAPSIRFNIPAMLSEQIARKLFAGRHAPSIVGNDDKTTKAAMALAEEAKLDSLMIQACTWGSVGSAAVTFKIVEGKGDKPTRVIANVWQAKVCRPKFDVYGDLERLRVNYPVEGHFFLEQDVTTDADGQPVKADQEYWYIRDYTTDREITYKPSKVSKKDAWNPLEVKSPKLVVGGEVAHNLGFVPGHWFINLSLGDYPDGACKWQRSMPTMIEMDYRMSQLGMAVGYNSSPQVVIKGELMNMEEQSGGTIVRGPTRYLQIKPDLKDSEGFAQAGNDVKLLEMMGTGVEVALKFVLACKKLVIAELSASQKDPDKVTTAMSGKGMEVLDQEYVDQLQEYRTCYSKNGFLPLLKKMTIAAVKVKHPLVEGVSVEEAAKLTLGFPQAHDIAPGEFMQLVQGLDLAIEGGIISLIQGQDLVRSQVDVPVVSFEQGEGSKPVRTPLAERRTKAAD